MPNAARTRRYLEDGGRDIAIIAFAVAAGLTYTILLEFILPLLPVIEAELGASPSDATWLATGFLISGVVVGPVVARWCDIEGPRRPVVFCLSAFVIGAAVCLAADSIGVLILGRVIEGMGAGIFGVAMALVRRGVAPDRVRLGISMVSGTLGFGAGIGAVLAGIVLKASSNGYHLVFLISLIIAAVALVACVIVIPHSDPTHKESRPLDLIGALLMGGWLTCALLALGKGQVWGWGSTAVIALIVGAVVLFPIWLLAQLRAPDPLIDVRLFLPSVLGLTLIVEFFAGFATTGTQLGLSQFVQIPEGIGTVGLYGFGASVLVAGLLLLPVGLGNFTVAPFVATYGKRIGLNATLMVGPLLLTASFAFIAVVHDALWQAVVCSVIVGLGLGMVYSTSANRWVIGMPRERIGVTYTAVGNVINIGTSASSALFAALAASHTIAIAGPSPIVLPGLAAFTTLWWACAGAGVAAFACAALATVKGPGFGRGDVEYVRRGNDLVRTDPAPVAVGTGGPSGLPVGADAATRG